jgi:phenylacetate-CoA ligase
MRSSSSSLRTRLVTLAATAKRSRLLDLSLRYNPLFRPTVLRSIQRAEASGLDNRRQLSDDLTARIIAAARRTEYGRQFGGAIGDWPIVSKSQVRDDPARFVARGLLTVPAATGGTTGLPLKLERSPRCIAAEQAFLDHIIRTTGFTWRGARIASLRGDNVKSTLDWSPPFGEETQGGRRLLLSSAHLNAKTVAWYHDRLRAFAPDLLWAYPTTVTSLLRLLAAQQLQLSIPIVLCSSERLTSAAMTRLAEGFGARVIDYYGLAERVCLAVSDTPDRHFFHPAYGKVELLPVEAAEESGPWRQMRIVATGFWNEAMPLIRYDTGDRAQVPRDASAAEIEAIELGLAPFIGVAGRTSDFLYARDGGRLAGIDQIPREVDHLLQIQVIQESLDLVTIKALVAPGFGPADRARLEANARLKIPSPAQIRLDIVDRLEALESGKTPYVIRRIAEP